MAHPYSDLLWPIEWPKLLATTRADIDAHLRAPSKATRLCRGCPVKTQCILWATENGLDGNWGGTSKKERQQFARVQHLVIRPVENVMPDEPKRVDEKGRRISRYRIVRTTISDYSWMDSAVSPLD